MYLPMYITSLLKSGLTPTFLFLFSSCLLLQSFEGDRGDIRVPVFANVRSSFIGALRGAVEGVLRHPQCHLCRQPFVIETVPLLKNMLDKLQRLGRIRHPLLGECRKDYSTETESIIILWVNAGKTIAKTESIIPLWANAGKTIAQRQNPSSSCG